MANANRNLRVACPIRKPKKIHQLARQKKKRELNAKKVEKVGEKFSQLFFCFNVIVNSAFFLQFFGLFSALSSMLSNKKVCLNYVDWNGFAGRSLAVASGTPESMLWFLARPLRGMQCSNCLVPGFVWTFLGHIHIHIYKYILFLDMPKFSN